MNISTMRFIDEKFGPIICSFLGFFNKHDGQDVKNVLPRKILILKLFGMGSIIHTVPAILALKKYFPDSQITFLTLPQNRQILEVLPGIDKIISFDFTSARAFIKNMFLFMITIRKEKYDLFVDMEFYANFSAILAFLTGIENSIGFATFKFWRDNLYKTTVAYDQTRHISKVFLKVVYCLGINVTQGYPDSLKLEREFILKHKDPVKIEDIFKNTGISSNDMVIAMNINASELSYKRRWPNENFKILTEKLIQDSRIKIFLIGSKGEETYVDRFYQDFKDNKQVINLCGWLSVRELIGLFDRVSIFIGNDSGPLHLAAVLGLPTVSFFGPETPFLYGPVGDNHIVFYKDYYCSPCLNAQNYKNSACSNNICLKDINPQEVFAAFAQKFLSTR